MKTYLYCFLLSVALCLLSTGCLDHDHEHHDHGHHDDHKHDDHEEHDHEEHDDHKHDDHGHNDHEEHHDHGGHHAHEGEMEPVVVTQYNGLTELFMEYNPLIKGESVTFIVHLTKLSNFHPVTEGSVEIKFSSAEGQEYAVHLDQPTRAGVYLIKATPPFAGACSIELSLKHADLNSVHRIQGVTVYANADEVEDMPHQESDAEEITVLKEQQWRTEYEIVQVEQRRIGSSIPATGHLRLPASRVMVVPATASGTISWSEKGLVPEVGMQVKDGQGLFSISPDGAWESGLVRLREQYLLADLEFTRLEGLLKEQAVAEKRVEEARIRRETLAESLTRMGVKIIDGKVENLVAQIKAPQAGTITEIIVRPGQRVQQGDPLAIIKNSDRMILEALFPSTRLDKVSKPVDASFRTGISGKAQLISHLDGRVISEEPIAAARAGFSRFLFEFENQNSQFAEGTAVSIRVLGEANQPCLAIPVEAVQEEQGLDLVYVQSGGETVEKRYPRLGISDGEWIEVLNGVSAGERVVTRGAQMVRLSSLGDMEMGHGHAH